MNWCCRRFVYDVEKTSNSIEVRRRLSTIATAKADVLPVKDNQVTIVEFAGQWLRRRRSSARTAESHEA